MINQEAVRFNLAIQNSNIKSLIRFASSHDELFDPKVFVNAVSNLRKFPFISIAEMASALEFAGASLRPQQAHMSEIISDGRPILAYIKRRPSQRFSTDLLEIVNFELDYVFVRDCNSELIKLQINVFKSVYCGIIFIYDSRDNRQHLIKNKHISNVAVFHEFLTTSECQELRYIGDKIGFYEILCNDFVQTDTLCCKRDSLGQAVDLQIKDGDCVKYILDKAASTLGVSIENLEGIHIRRLLPSDCIPPRYDNGVNLQRHSALHFSFGAAPSALSFRRISTFQEFSLAEGNAVTISTSDERGRTNWCSAWTGHPHLGVCYVGSCWSRIPTLDAR